MEQRTDEWFAARAGKVTASRLNDVMMAKTTAGFQNYQAQLICERLTSEPTETFTSNAMQHGTETEPQARAMYSLETGFEVQEVGFIDHPDLAMSGASPDGLCGSDGLVEIKCPQPAKHIKTIMGANIDKGYVRQMQWQMECTGRQWCDFVSFCPMLPDHMQLHIQRVDFDAELVAEIKTAVTSFLAELDAKAGQLNQLYSKAA